MSASTSTYRVINRGAPRAAAQRGIEQIANRIRDDLVANTPRDTGRLAAGWRVQPGRAPAVYLVVNSVPYARPREFNGRPYMGPVIARWRSLLGRRRR